MQGAVRFRCSPLACLGALALLVAAAGCRADDGFPRGPTSTSTGTSSGGGGSGGGGGNGGGGETAPGEPLTVVTWNARNYFDDLNNSDAPNETVLSTSAYQQKRAAVGAVLRDLDADVVILQEVENLGVLKTLDEAELGGAYPHAALIEAFDPRGIDIGALSKVPFDGVVSHLGETFTKEGTNGPVYQYARDALELHLTRNGRHVVLIGVHFRSKSQDDPDKRLAEAQHTRAIADGIAAADPTAAIAILGDFNDLPGSPPVLAVEGSGSGADAYDDVPALAPASDRWTFNYNGALELVDHHLVNPVLRAMLDEASVRIPHGPDIDAASDHAPIEATYSITAP